jgi:hypothetical protein
MEPSERTDVYALLRYTLELYIVSAWQHMGFLPDPATGQTHLALEEAQIAIDCATFWQENSSRASNQRRQREYERRLRDLKLTFSRSKAKRARRHNGWA